MPIEWSMKRRRLLRTGAWGGLAWLVGGCNVGGVPTSPLLTSGQGPLFAGRRYRYPRGHDPAYSRVVLLADTHVDADASTFSRDGVNMADQLRQVVEAIGELDPRPATVLVNGDNAYDTGTPGDYRQLIELLEPLPREHGIDVLFTLGNHDHRANFLAAFPEPPYHGEWAEQHDRVFYELLVANAGESVCWVCLDSLLETDVVPGQLGDAQLQRLDDALADTHGQTRPDGSLLPNSPVVLYLHHPPIRSEEGKRAWALLDRDAFWKVVSKHPTVQAVLHGHTHRWDVRKWTLEKPDGSERDVPLIGLPPTSYVFREGDPWGYVVADVDQAGMTLTLRAMDGHTADGEAVRIDWV